MGPKNRGPRPKQDADEEFLDDLRTSFRWIGDRFDVSYAADPTGWWANPSVLRRLGPMLARPAVEMGVTHVLSPTSRGALLGALVALELGVASPGERRLV